jgi:sulfonate transport system substrate-binding protein
VRTGRSAQPIIVGGVPEHFNLPWKLAIEQGAFAAAGLDVEWVDEPAGTGAITAALADGRFDLATVLTEGLVAAQDRGLDAHIEQLYVASPLKWGIHVPCSHAALPLTEIANLRVAISRLGSGSHLMAHVLAASEGFTIDPANFVVVGTLAGGIEALATERADVFLWETFMTKPWVDNGQIARIGEIPTPWPAFVVARRRGFGHRRAQQVLQVVDEAVAAFVARTDAAQLVAERIGIPQTDAEAWLARTRFARGERLDRAAIDAIREQLRSAGAT